MSEYVRSLREKIGNALLEVPTVSVLTFDQDRRVLLVRHVEGDLWTTPGGMIEPYETPADAAVREMWEETGLYVELTHVIGVFGGPVCSETYANGDRIAWVSTVFGAKATSGELQPDGDETLEVRYVGRDELSHLRCKPHVDLFLDAAFAQSPVARFQPAVWKPPHA
ncbi:MAG: NUDIX domain-containing protein [Betaproteobacteria bacterium]|nr:NUDIX domain-containing protein [Betaproteobacteria bacterium]